MKNLLFKPNQKEHLLEIIDLGILEYNDEEYSKIGKIIKEKIQRENWFFSNKEYSCLKSFTVNWYNKNEAVFKEIRDLFWNKDPNNYLSVSDENVEKMRVVDSYRMIVQVLFNERQFLYNSVFEKIKVLKSIDKIYMSLSQGKPYKISFIDLKRKCHLDIRFERFSGFEVVEFQPNTVAYLREKSKDYTHVLDRIQASEILIDYAEKQEDSFNNIRVFLSKVLS